MKAYKHIFFDLDHTLWDFEKNSEEVLHELFALYSFSRLQLFTIHELVNKFTEVNNILWHYFNRGDIDKNELRTTRFRIILSSLGVSDADIPESIGEKYLELCPQKSNVMPYTIDVLEYLKSKYRLHIITNGFEDVQHIKLRSSKLITYFDIIMTSDLAGCQKPEKKIFEQAMAYVQAKPEECMMIGDNPETDILGALNVAMDAVYYNPVKKASSHTATYEISCLSELKLFL